jgi:mRNA interferase RelE/StbE
VEAAASMTAEYSDPMPREIEICNKAEKDLRAIPKRDGERIARAIMSLKSALTGDVKRLTNFTPEYRLRVGDWRVLFEIEKDKITIYPILHRREAYRG